MITKAQKTLLLEQYVQLARKLSKMPSEREVRRFICSADKIRTHFGKLSVLKTEALKAYPELDVLTMPAVLTKGNIDDYRLGLEAKKRVKTNDKLIKHVSTLEYIAEYADKVFTGKIKPYNPPKSKSKLTRALNLTLSDLHFGADIKDEETGYLSYGKVEESRRFAAVIKQTIEYKQQYRKETELHVNLLGDIIQNKLHDPQDAAALSEQICRAIHLLSQGLALLAETFPKVYVHCAVGNHGRDLARHKERATSGKWDCVETVIYYSVKQALVDYKNVEFHIPKTPFVMYDVLGNKIFATHGDNVLNPGNPGKAINIGSLENQLNRINASFEDKNEVKVAIVGHTHCPSVSYLSCGAAMITNGCLCPVDQFAVSIGILENLAAQVLFESVAYYPMGDVRFIKVGKEHDTDKSLDFVIRPFTNI